MAGNGGRPRRIQEAKNRTPTSDRLDRDDNAFLKKISADIRSGKLKKFNNKLVKETYGVGDARLIRVRKHLVDMRLITKSGKKYKVAALAA